MKKPQRSSVPVGELLGQKCVLGAGGTLAVSFLFSPAIPDTLQQFMNEKFPFTWE